MFLSKPLKIVFVFFLLINTSKITAQDYYLHFNAGYGLGLPGEEVWKTNRDTNFISTSIERLQFGGGLHSSVSFGIMTSDNWGVDFQFYYQKQFGDGYTNESRVERPDENGNINLYTYDFKNSYKTWSVGFTPSLKMEGDFRNVIPFISLGPSIYYNFINSHRINKIDGVVNYERIEEYYGKLSFGIIAASGFEFELSRDLYLTTSLRASYGYMKPVKSKVIKSGDTDLKNVPISQKEYEYVNELNNSEPRVDEKPTKLLSFTWDYSSVSLMAGIKWILN